MKYKLKVEYDPKMPLDRYELIYNPQDLELLKKLGEKKEEKEGIGAEEKEGKDKAEAEEENAKAKEGEGNGKERDGKL